MTWHNESKAMNKAWLGAIFFGGALSGAAVLYASQLLPISAESTPQSTPTATQQGTLTPGPVAALGRLEPRDKVLNLAPPSTASISRSRVAELRVEEGDTVTLNQIIAVLDTHQERQKILREATAQVKSAQIQLEQVLAGAKRGEVDAQIAQVSQLEAQLKGNLSVQDARLARLQAEYDNAVAEYRRSQALFEDGATSASSRDARETAMISARRRIQEAEETRSQLLSTGQNRIREAKATLERIREVRPVDVAFARAEIEKAQATESLAKVGVENTLVRAPFAGQVLRIHARPGEVIDDEGIVTLGQTDAMYAIAEVYEADLPRVAVGQRATITSEYGGFSGSLSGTVERLGFEVLSNSLYDPNPSSQSEVRIIEVAIRLDPADGDRVRHLTNLQLNILIDTD